MPRRKNRVKRFLKSPGLIDLHFHGAFGIDLMNASSAELNTLSRQLGQSGIAGFCPTTLSAPIPDLIPSLERLGSWIRQKNSTPPEKGSALPLGIHLEGPFLSAQACGAHPPSALHAFDMEILLKLWEASQHTLKILTIAPELLTPAETRKLAHWCKKQAIHLSAGHTRVTQSQAQKAFDLGFQGVTHAWNAMPFHHRDPGLMGAALGRPDIWVELIADQKHVDTTVMRWTTQLHSHGVCWVSDCAPAAATRQKTGTWYSFGPTLKVQAREGGCYTDQGHLAGGGLLLPDAYRGWLLSEVKKTGFSLEKLLKKSLPWATGHPLSALKIPIPPGKLPVQLEWDLQNAEFHCKRFD